MATKRQQTATTQKIVSIFIIRCSFFCFCLRRFFFSFVWSQQSSVTVAVVAVAFVVFAWHITFHERNHKLTFATVLSTSCFRFCYCHLLAEQFHISPISLIQQLPSCCRKIDKECHEHLIFFPRTRKYV